MAKASTNVNENFLMIKLSLQNYIYMNYCDMNINCDLPCNEYNYLNYRGMY